MRGSKRTARKSGAVLKQPIQPRPGANLPATKQKSGKLIAHRESLRCASYVTDGLKRFRIPSQRRLSKRATPSDCDLWLARCAQKLRNGFSASSRNAHIQILKEVFAMALRDRIISPFAPKLCDRFRAE
jgi:hypothetical protein